jgi:hypothetical protein
MKPKVYMETSIVSYLTAYPSRDLIIAAHQQISRDWWQSVPGRFEIYISQFVLDEISKGDPDVAGRRLNIVKAIPLLEITEEVWSLAAGLVASRIIPKKAGTDAAHIALAAIQGMDFLVTWNCRHIANAVIARAVEKVCSGQGFQCPVICTPEELMGGIP